MTEQDNCDSKNRIHFNGEKKNKTSTLFRYRTDESKLIWGQDLEKEAGPKGVTIV